MIRKRDCDLCGKSYKAKHASSRFCSAYCRTKNHQQKVINQRVEAALAAESAGNQQDSPDGDDTPKTDLITVTRRTLVEAGKFDTVAGQQAMSLAEAMMLNGSGAGIAAVSKALTAVMEEISGSSGVADDLLDELKSRRERRRAS